MAYKISVEPSALRRLWLLKTYLGAPPIAEQIRCLIRDMIVQKERELGGSLESICEAIEKHSFASEEKD